MLDNADRGLGRSRAARLRLETKVEGLENELSRAKLEVEGLRSWYVSKGAPDNAGPANYHGLENAPVASLAMVIDNLKCDLHRGWYEQQEWEESKKEVDKQNNIWFGELADIVDGQEKELRQLKDKVRSLKRNA